MGHSIKRKTLIANLKKARAARKVSQERTRKNLLRKQMAAERIARVQRHYATTSPLYILSQVALGAL
jgi:hypothetical protein